MYIAVELGPPNAKGSCQIKLVFTRKGHKRARWAVPEVRVTKAQWKKGEVRFGVKHAALLNERIRAAMDRARALALEHEGIAPATLREKMGQPERKGAVLLAEAFQQAYEQNEHRWKHGTKKQRRLIVNDARQALPATSLGQFSHADLLTLDRWYTAHARSSNTRRNRLRKFEAMYAMACRLYGIPMAVRPSSIAPDEVKSHKVRLDEAQVEVLRSASWSLPTAWLRLAAHTWLLQYDLGGLRFGEVCRLHQTMWQENAFRWVDERDKVPKPRHHPAMVKARAIIDYYAGHSLVLPLIPEGLSGDDQDRAIESANTKVNRELKAVCSLLGLPSLTTHTARHSAAQRMKTRLKDIHITSKILGHATVEQTRTYLDELDTTPIDEAFEALS